MFPQQGGKTFGPIPLPTRRVAEVMNEIAYQGASPSARRRCSTCWPTQSLDTGRLRNSVELVSGYPRTGHRGMEDSRDTWVVVQNLFRDAQESVLIAGYAICQGRKRAPAQKMHQLPNLGARMAVDGLQDQDVSFRDLGAMTNRRVIHRVSALWSANRSPEPAISSNVWAAITPSPKADRNESTNPFGSQRESIPGVLCDFLRPLHWRGT